jgi:hypothetical protein
MAPPPQSRLQELLDAYLEARDEEVREIAEAIVREAATRLGAWTQEINPALAERFQEELEKYAPGSSPDVEAGDLGVILIRWHFLGISLSLASLIADAETLFRTMLSVLRRSQLRLGRLHKGTPLHDLGWLRLPTDPDAATPYFLAALIEDVMSDPDGFTTRPAARVCLNVLGRDAKFFDEARDFVEAEIPGPELVQALARQDPEVLSLVRSMNDPPGSEFLQISLHFDPAIGDLLQSTTE